MAAPVFCNGCGTRVVVPEGYARSKLRCPECGVFNEVTKVEARETRRKPASTQEDDAYAALDAEAPRPAPKTSKPKAAKPKVNTPERTDESAEEANEVLIHGTDADDGNPYRVTGDKPTKFCPECDTRIERKAKVCVQCGYNFETATKAERTFQPVNREWENGWPMQKRIAIFVVLQVVNFITLAASVIGNHSLPVSFLGVLFSVGLQAFLVGTYDTLKLTRNQKGKVTITRTWRYAFIPRLPETVRWKEHDSVTMVRDNEFNLIDWVIAFILLGYCVIPAIVYWWHVIRPDKFTVALCKDHGFPETILFRTRNEDRAKEIETEISDVTTLPVRK